VAANIAVLLAFEALKNPTRRKFRRIRFQVFANKNKSPAEDRGAPQNAL
jgi:hypothetical protein